MTVISDVYFDVARILSKTMRHHIIKLSHKTFISKGMFGKRGHERCSYVGHETGNIYPRHIRELYSNSSENIFSLTGI